MNKSAAFVVGAAIGAVAAFGYAWLFGPAAGTTYDSHYRSRLDHARAEGELAATQKQAELTTQYTIARSQGINAAPDA